MFSKKQQHLGDGFRFFIVQFPIIQFSIFHSRETSYQFAHQLGSFSEGLNMAAVQYSNVMGKTHRLMACPACYTTIRDAVIQGALLFNKEEGDLPSRGFC